MTDKKINDYFKVVMISPGTIFKCIDDEEIYILTKDLKWKIFTKEFRESFPNENPPCKSMYELHELICTHTYCDHKCITCKKLFKFDDGNEVVISHEKLVFLCETCMLDIMR